MLALASDRGWRSPALFSWLLLPFLTAVAAYAWTLGGFFVSDDFAMLHRASTARDWLEASHLPRTGHMSWLRPVSQWSWWVQWGLGGLDPLGYRCLNVAFHGCNASLVAWLTGVLVRGPGGELAARRGGALAGVAFALAPIHPEAVTWLSGRVDVLSTTGVLVALLAWLRFCQPDGRRRHLALAYAGLCFGLGAKEMAGTLPVMAGVLWLVRAGGTGRPRRTRLLGLCTLGVLVGGYVLIRYRVLDGLGGVATSEGSSVQSRFDLAHAARFQLRALHLSLAPLHRDFHRGDGHPLYLAQVAGWLALGGLATLGARTRASWRALLLVAATLLVLFVVATAPIAGWGHVNDRNFMSARYLYLPSVFAAVFLGTLGAWASAAGGRARALAAGAVLLVLGPWTYQLFEVNGAWRRAAAECERMLATLPTQAELPRLAVTGLPDNTGGAYVMRVGFELGAELFTDRVHRVVVLEPEAWAVQREKRLSQGVPAAAFRRWDREGGWVTDP